MRKRSLFVGLALLAAACASAPPEPDGDAAPTAPRKAFDHNEAAKAPAPDVPIDPQSTSRPLGYVEGDVITYREVLQRVGPELAALDSREDKAKMEERALLDIVRERMMYRTAVDARVSATRDEIEAERARRVKDLTANGRGTLEAFLHERDMTRREFDDLIRTQIILEKYQRAAIGHGDGSVHVRPVTDTYVPPEEVRKYYDRHPEKFKEPALARCRMLVVKTDFDAKDREKAVAEATAKAQEALARLKAGEDWVPVFRQVNQGAADADPLDGLIEIHKGDTYPAAWIQDFAFKSEKGVLSDVIRVGTTSYVLRAEGAHEARTIPFDEEENQIRGLLTSVRAQLAWLEVQVSVLDESSIQPDSLRARLRETLRQARLKLLSDNGL